MTKKFHLGWFMNFTPPDWESEWASPDVAQWANGRFYVDMARAMERACFDFMMIEDTVMVADAYGGTMEGSLKNAIFAPKQDPVPLAIQVACNTTNLGVVATMSTSFYPPYLLARLCSTADSIAQGRFGWNIVSSAEDRAAQNFGLEGLPEHDERYNVAEEYFDVVNQLWDSWEADAVVMDRQTHTFADYRKVHTIDFDGKYFKSRGPLNTVPSPQHRPTFLQAGASPKGRQFAAGAADAIIAVGTGVEGMKEYRDDVRARAKASGRNPDDIKLFFVVSPTIAAAISSATCAGVPMNSIPNDAAAIASWRSVLGPGVPSPRMKCSREPRSPLVVRSAGSGSSRSNCLKSISVFDEILTNDFSM